MTDGSRIFEPRTYTSSQGQLPALEQRFRDHTLKLFDRHGMDAVGFFVPMGSEDTLVYLLGFENEESATRSWAAFRSDADWRTVKADSEKYGAPVVNVESRLLVPTDFSAGR